MHGHYACTQSLFAWLYIILPAVRSTADDEVVLQRNREELNKEVKKEKPKKEVILALSRHTFPERRALVVSESGDVTATSLLQEFPELHKPYVVSTIYIHQCVP